MGRRDDELPDRLYEPLETGVLAGKALDRDQMQRSLDWYYEMMGWDVETGTPRPARLEELNIADLTQF
jgi:aldehyde:ferredoxin oxidoreductase